MGWNEPSSSLIISVGPGEAAQKHIQTKLNNKGEIQIPPNTTIQDFGTYSDPQKYDGGSISHDYIKKLIVLIVGNQTKESLAFIQGTFGKVICRDHTRKIAKKAEQLSGQYWSLTVYNEFCMVVTTVNTLCGNT